MSKMNLGIFGVSGVGFCHQKSFILNRGQYGSKLIFEPERKIKKGSKQAELKTPLNRQGSTDRKVGPRGPDTD